MVWRATARGVARIIALLVSLAALVGFLAQFDSSHPLVNHIAPFTRIDTAPYPTDPRFPVIYEALGSGDYRATVTNGSTERKSVWCAVEVFLDDETVVFADFKVGPIPPGETKTVTGHLDGSGDGPYSGGCKETSY
jgi:hypothetical protein